MNCTYDRFKLNRTKFYQVVLNFTVTSCTNLSLYHGGALRAQSAYSLEHVHDAFVLHALQHSRQSYEHAGTTDARAVSTNIIENNVINELLELQS